MRNKPIVADSQAGAIAQAASVPADTKAAGLLTADDDTEINDAAEKKESQEKQAAAVRAVDTALDHEAEEMLGVDELKQMSEAQAVAKLSLELEGVRPRGKVRQRAQEVMAQWALENKQQGEPQRKQHEQSLRSSAGSDSD